MWSFGFPNQTTTILDESTSTTIATNEDWDTEYLDLILSINLVDGIDGALEHIAEYGSNHTEAIITENKEHATRFLREADASLVLVNASTRFNDGFQLGLGAEMGISTTKLHAYGPMGLNELCTMKVGRPRNRTGTTLMSEAISKSAAKTPAHPFSEFHRRSRTSPQACCSRFG